MALMWDWNKPCGYAIVSMPDGGRERLTLYKGNTFLLFMADDGDEYELVGFWLSESHAKNCLGLTKGYNRWSLNIKAVTLYPTECEWVKISKLLIKAYPDIHINIRPILKAGGESE